MEILPQLLVNALITGSIYALASSGLSLTYGLLRVLNFAHGHLLMVGAYLFYLTYVLFEWSLVPAALFTALSSILLGLITMSLFVQPFISYSYILPLITTLALGTILEASVSIFFGVNVKSLLIGYDLQSYQIGDVFITPIQILIISSALSLLILAAFFIHHTSFGRKVRALSESSHAAEALGISSRRINYTVFSLSTLLSVYAGVLIGFETNLQPTMGNAYTIKAFAAMILGGLGNIWGTVVGSYLLGLVENLAIGLDFGGFSLPAGYKDAFAFLIILLMLLFRPYGLFRTGARTA